MPFQSLLKALLVFIQLLGDSFPPPESPTGRVDMRTKMATFANEDTAKAICHWGITTHSFSRPYFLLGVKIHTVEHKTLACRCGEYWPAVSMPNMAAFHVACSG